MFNMTDGEKLSKNDSIVIQSGFLGSRLSAFGGFFISDTEYVL